MGARPSRGSAASGHARRAAKISQFELADSAPDLRTLLKRKVNDFDLLEISDHAAWVTKVAAITKPSYRKLFQGSNCDRLQFRYAVYGWDAQQLQVVYNQLVAAFGS